MPGTSEKPRRHYAGLRLRGRIWWIAWHQGGERKRQSTGTANYKEALRKYEEIRGRIARGERIAPANVTFEQLCDGLRSHYRVNGLRSLSRAETSINNLKAFFAGYRAAAITTDQMRAYIVQRQAQGAANATVQCELSALGKMLNLAVDDGRLSQRPKIPRLKVDNARQGFFEWEDLQAVVAELPAELRPPILFAHYTGWRIGEVLSLTWRQVDFDAGMVRLEPGTTKNGKGRTFPFAALPPLHALLTEQRTLTDAVQREIGAVVPWVFHHDGRQVRTYRRRWSAAIDAAAHEGAGVLRRVIRPQLLGRIVHDLRRTAVRNFERAGVPRSVGMKLTGHLTESVYNRYAIVSEADLKEGVGKLATLASGVRSGALPFPSARTGTP